MTAGSNTGLSVVKIGGALTQVPAELDRVCRAVSSAAAHHRLLVVPGGGPFADAVRSVQVNLSLSNDAAHWMAILAMDQYALLLAERIEGGVLLDEPGAVAGTVIPGRAAILAPYLLTMREAAPGGYHFIITTEQGEDEWLTAR